MNKQLSILFNCLIVGLFVACHARVKTTVAQQPHPKTLSTQQTSLMENLHHQTETTTTYNPAYVSLAYPNGDVDSNTGVCADVVVRALRAVHIDLQKEIHEDISKHFSAYPNRWGMSKPDKNIDHRRVHNIMKYFERKGNSIPITTHADDYLPGDIVAWKLDNGLYHVGMISDEIDETETPLIIHNIGSGTKTANVLFRWKIIGHYRIRAW